jgi:peptidoglycan/LPS O-acetylase OafA/YrhL
VAASSALALEDPGDGRSLSITRGHVDALTGLRGFAALVVLTVHVSGRTDYSFIGIHGYGPVSLFVLSGFLLFRPWSLWALGLGARPNLRTLARHRASRIFPAYLVVVLIVAVVLPASQPLGIDGWIRTLTLTNTTSSTGLRPGMEHTWSLGTEVSWYFALPVVGLLVGTVARRVAPERRSRLVVGLFALGLPLAALWRWWLEVAELNRLFTYSFWLPGFMACFLGGAAVCHVIQADRAGLARSRFLRWLGETRPWFLVGVAVIVGSIGNSALGGPWDYLPATFSERQIRFVCVTALALLLLVGAALGTATSPVTGVLSWTWLVAVGRWSYSIYLWHLPVIVLLAPHIARDGIDGFLRFYGLTLALTIPLGAATYAWVERPAIAWSKRTRASGEPATQTTEAERTSP